MRYLFFLALLLTTSFTLAAQSITPDPLLSAHFSQEQLDEMADGRVAYWNYYIDNAYSITDIPAEKRDALIDQLSVLDMPSEGFNAFTIDLMAHSAKGVMLRFKDEEKMLVIQPLAKLNDDFNAYYQNTLKK